MARLLKFQRRLFQLIENDSTINTNIDFVKPSLIDRYGHPPIYRFFTTNQDQISFLLKEIQILTNDYLPSEICIVAKEKRLIESM